MSRTLSAKGTFEPKARLPWTKLWPRPSSPKGQRVIIQTFDLIDQLPAEMVTAILGKLSLQDLYSVSQVSRKFNNLSRIVLWRMAKFSLFWFPLFYGAANGIISLMEEALRLGAPIDKPWFRRWTGKKYGYKMGQRPLHLAVANHQLEAVEWLLAHGARTDLDHSQSQEDDLSLLLLASGWKDLQDCDHLGRKSEARLSMLDAWKPGTGPRYLIFHALMEAGVRPPPGQEALYLRLAAASCRIISAPTLQLMLQYGANPNHLCSCPLHYRPQPGEADESRFYWIWTSPGDGFPCPHLVNFLPWPKPVGELINMDRMCARLAELDRGGRQIFFPSQGT